MSIQDEISFTQEEFDDVVVKLSELAFSGELRNLFVQGTPFVESVATYLDCSHHLAGMAMAVGGSIPVISSELQYVYTKLYP